MPLGPVRRSEKIVRAGEGARGHENAWRWRKETKTDLSVSYLDPTWLFTASLSALLLPHNHFLDHSSSPSLCLNANKVDPSTSNGD